MTHGYRVVYGATEYGVQLEFGPGYWDLTDPEYGEHFWSSAGSFYRSASPRIGLQLVERGARGVGSTPPESGVLSTRQQFPNVNEFQGFPAKH